jgi:hypothetical protein
VWGSDLATLQAQHKEPVNVISKSHQNRPAFSMTAVITTAKDGRLGADS